MTLADIRTVLATLRTDVAGNESRPSAEEICHRLQAIEIAVAQIESEALTAEIAEVAQEEIDFPAPPEEEEARTPPPPAPIDSLDEAAELDRLAFLELPPPGEIAEDEELF